MQLIKLLIIVFLLISCRKAEIDGGQCELKCSQRVAPSFDFTVEPLSKNKSVSLICDAISARSSYHSSITSRFIVYKNNPKTSVPTSSEDSSSSSLIGLDFIPSQYPIAGVSFQPALVGQLDGTKTLDEFKVGSGENASYEFQGLATTKEEWCSDTCGVMTYKFWPLCLQGETNVIDASVVTGAVKATGIKYSLTNSVDK